MNQAEQEKDKAGEDQETHEFTEEAGDLILDEKAVEEAGEKDKEKAEVPEFHGIVTSPIDPQEAYRSQDRYHIHPPRMSSLLERSSFY